MLIIIVDKRKFLKNLKKRTLSLILLLISLKIIVTNLIFIIISILMRNIEN